MVGRTVAAGAASPTTTPATWVGTTRCTRRLVSCWQCCPVMLSDGLTSLQAGGSAREEVEVLDVAQLLLAAVQRPAVPDQAAAPGAEPVVDPVATRAEPQPGDVTHSADTVSDYQDVGAD